MSYRALSLLIGALAALPAAAEQPIEFHAELTHTYDSNVPRLSSRVDPLASLGTPATSDTVDRILAGAAAQVTLGRQRLLVDADASRYFYNRFSGLDHTDARGTLNWEWELGHAWSGTLGHARDAQLTSFSVNQSPTPDRRHRNQSQLRASYVPHPDWRISGEVRYLEETHALPVMQVYDRDMTSEMIELRYQTPLDNALGARAVHSNNRLPNRQTIGNTLIDNSYKNNVLTGFFNGRLTNNSRVALELGYQRVSMAELSSRNSSGWTGRASYSWTRLPTSFNLEVWRGIDTVSNEAASYVIEKGIRGGPRWEITPTLRSELLVVRQWNDRAGELSGRAQLREDRVDLARLSLTWEATKSVELGLSVETERRRSNELFAEYDYYLASVLLRARI